nr:LysR family transcriptional regulator [Endozoicomonas sp. OPT23]
MAVFVEVVECNGFAAAARKLKVSTSAVSKRVTQLEEYLGARLLHRTTRKISLTEAGERYFSVALEVVAAAQAAEDSVTELQTEPSGILKLATSTSFGRLHIAPLMSEFMKKHPGITVQMMMEDRVIDMVGEGFDLAIRGGDLPDSSMVARRLAPIHNILAASPDYLTEFGTPEKPDDLYQHNCLHYVYYHRGIEWALQKGESVSHIQPAGRFLVNNSEALVETMLRHSGIGRLPTFVASQYLKSGELIQVLPEYCMPEQVMYAVYPERRYLPAKVRVFIEYLIEKIGKDQPYWDEGVMT